MSNIDPDRMKLSELLYEAADQLAYDGNLFQILTSKALALEASRKEDRERIATLEGAARAVLSRWDDPGWEWDKHGHTAGLMADLRNALSNTNS